MHNIVGTISFVPILFFSAPSHSLASLPSIHGFLRPFSEDQCELLRTPAGGTERAADRLLPPPTSRQNHCIWYFLGFGWSTTWRKDSESEASVSVKITAPPAGLCWRLLLVFLWHLSLSPFLGSQPSFLQHSMLGSVVFDPIASQAPLPMRILQERILEWVATLSSSRSSHPGIKSKSPTLQEDSLPSEPLGKPNVHAIHEALS